MRWIFTQAGTSVFSLPFCAIHAGGKPGEIGGAIAPAGETAWYGKAIGRKTLDDPLRASGTLACPDGAFHVLLGFFNSGTTEEWRTPNTIALLLNGRGDHFFAYVEYCTSRWRAGGDTTPFPSRKDSATGRPGLVGFRCDVALGIQNACSDALGASPVNVPAAS